MRWRRVGCAVRSGLGGTGGVLRLVVRSSRSLPPAALFDTLRPHGVRGVFVRGAGLGDTVSGAAALPARVPQKAGGELVPRGRNAGAAAAALIFLQVAVWTKCSVWFP